MSDTVISAADEDLLRNPVYAALRGPHARFAETCGRVLRYPGDIAPFLGLPPEPTEQDWRDAAELVAPGTQVAIIQSAGRFPKTWTTVQSFEVLQLVGERVDGVEHPDVVRLGPADVSEMLALVRVTNPGPFLTRTVELGSYFGIRSDDQLIAMGGERLHIEGWTEISALCTAPDHRGQGLASRLVHALTAGIERRSESAFMHVLTTNASAIRLYEELGFRANGRLRITAVTRVSAARERARQAD